MPSLVGVTEAAAILGWSRGKVSVYHGRGLLPDPVASLQSGTVWRREDILAYSVYHALGVDSPTRLVSLTAEEVANLRNTYGLHDGPIGAQLHAQGILTAEQAEWLDREVPA